MPVVELYGGASCLKIVPVKPDEDSGAPVRCGLLLGVSVLGVGFVDNVNLILEELVEFSEVLGNLVDCVGRNVPEK